MNFDIGLQGLGILVALSLVFGVVAHLIVGRSTRWMWLVGAVAYFIGGLYASEVVFATATEGDLQPLIDGLFLDEAMLGGLVVGIPVVLVAWYLTRHGGFHRHHPSPS